MTNIKKGSKSVLAFSLAFAMIITLIINGLPLVFATAPTAKGQTIGDWGAHNYIAEDDDSVVSALSPGADGSLQISGDQVIAGKGIGATYVKPVYLDKEGFSINFSLDQYDTASADKWFALSLMDKSTITNDKNSDDVFKQWDNTDAKDSAEGKGWVMIMRPGADGRITFQHFYYGVTSNTDATSANSGYVYLGDGCYDNIKLNSGNFKNIKVDFVKRPDNGGYNIVFNDGEYTRVDGSGNPAERVDEGGEINPGTKLNLVDEIFPTGSPAFVKMVAYNASTYDTKFSINSINGKFANTENIMGSWGVHNYVTGGGSLLENSLAVDHLGNVILSGNQAAGEGELGVTYARPINIKNGFDIEFSLDNYVKHGVGGNDSWISLQISNKDKVVAAGNSDPVYHKMDAGGGNPDYGSGLVMLIRPQENNVLGVGDIFWNGVKFSNGNASLESSWDHIGGGAYTAIKVDDFKNIKIAFVPKDGGFIIRINDGVFERVEGDRIEDGGGINPHNTLPQLNQLFGYGTPAYVSLVYHHNKNEADARFTVHSFNGQQATSNEVDSWGAHNYTALDGSEVATEVSQNESGGATFSGYQTGGHGGIGATWKRPINVADGFSVEFSLDEYRLHGNGNDVFIGLNLKDRAMVTDVSNPDGAYRHFEVSNPNYGVGLVMLMRPLEDNVLGIGEILWNGVTFTPEQAVGEHWVNASEGCYSAIKVPSFSNIKIEFVSDGTDGFYIVFNDGDFLRVGADRSKTDHGRINIDNRFENLSKLFSNGSPAYLSMIYKDSTSSDASFTIHKVNGISAMPKKIQGGEEEVKAGVYELFRDLKFENGFRVTGMDSAVEGTQQPYYLKYGNASLRPSWVLAQWDSKYDFRNEDATLFMSPEDDVYIYENPSKVLTVDTSSGEIGMRLNASEVYNLPRKDGERWPHLLISDNGLLSGSENKFALKLKNSDHLRLQLNQKLSYFKDFMGEGANPSLHASSFYLYLYVKGTNEKGNTEMMWFGVPLFDNRYPFPGEAAIQDGGKDDASGLFIYNVPSRAFAENSFHKDGVVVGGADSDWMNVDLDLLPFVKRALYLANSKGFMKGVTMETLFIDGMNMGWENPGTYDSEMTVKNMSLKSYIDNTYEDSKGLTNWLVSDMKDDETVNVDGNLTISVPKNILAIDEFDDSILTLKALAFSNKAGTGIKAGKVEKLYSGAVIVNGNEYNYDFDNAIEIKFTIDASLLKEANGDASKINLYLFNGATYELAENVTFDKATNTFTLSALNWKGLAVVNAAKSVSDDDDENGDGKGTDPPATGQSSAIPIAALGITSVVSAVVNSKKRKEDSENNEQ